jgi:hypothetical protein
VASVARDALVGRQAELENLQEAQLFVRLQQRMRLLRRGKTRAAGDLRAVSLSDRLLAQGLKVSPRSHAGMTLRRQGVGRSAEFERIKSLPRRVLDLSKVEDLTPAFAKDGSTWALRPIQSAALWEMEKANGLFGAIGVGHGKTLISLLAPTVLESKKAVLLVPPQLREQLKKNIPILAKQFNLPLGQLKVVAYSELSTASSADVLEREAPDLIVADEAHSLRHRDSARTKRFMRFAKDNPGCRYVFLSGSMASKSVKDYAHLIELALRKNSPLPFGYREMEDWAEALDPSDDPLPPGALLELCGADAPKDLSDQAAARWGFRRRLVETPGVVATEESGADMSLVLAARIPVTPVQEECLAALERHHGITAAPGQTAKIAEDRYLLPVGGAPSKVLGALEGLRETWAIGDVEFSEPMHLAAAARQVALGFYYRWDWPGGVKDEEWLLARREWARAVRDVLRYRSRPGLDSEMLVANAAMRGELAAEGQAAWAAWDAVRERPKPPTVAVWIDDFAVRDAMAWGRDGGIVWYEHVDFGRELARLSGYPYCGPGKQSAEFLSRVDPKVHPAIVCSINSHKEGKDLQMYSRNLVTCPMASASEWEQVVGRTHRQGQEADEVIVDVYAYTAEQRAAMSAALKVARCLQERDGQKQKILLAQRVGIDEEG